MEMGTLRCFAIIFSDKTALEEIRIDLEHSSVMFSNLGNKLGDWQATQLTRELVMDI